MALEITDGNIKEIVETNNIVIIDFWAEWCGPCRVLGPVIDELAAENTDITIGKLNVDQNSVTTVEHGIRGIPALVFYKDGKIVDRMVGVNTKADLQSKINALKA